MVHGAEDGDAEDERWEVIADYLAGERVKILAGESQYFGGREGESESFHAVPRVGLSTWKYICSTVTGDDLYTNS